MGLICLLAGGDRDLQVQVAREPGAGGAVTVRGRFAAPVDRVWRVLTDQGAYPRIFPEIRSMAYVRAGSRGTVWRAEVALPWPIGDRWSEHEVESRVEAWTVRWRHLAGTLRENSGSWQLRAAPGGGTLVAYRSRFDPGVPLLPQWLLDWAVTIGIPKVVEDLRRYVGTGR
ncbi:MAG: SRPBCC family protein [Candidatus Sericytochromatia bacterium]|nr:SRPBCC family protein [Candidatus Tanganyikabacteria bacterium]